MLYLVVRAVQNGGTAQEVDAAREAEAGGDGDIFEKEQVDMDTATGALRNI